MSTQILDPLNAAIDYRIFQERGYGQIIRSKVISKIIIFSYNLEKLIDKPEFNNLFFPITKYFRLQYSVRIVINDNALAEICDLMLKCLSDYMITYNQFDRIFRGHFQEEMPAFLGYVKSKPEYCQNSLLTSCSNLDAKFNAITFMQGCQSVVMKMKDVYCSLDGIYVPQEIKRELDSDVKRDYSLYDRFDEALAKEDMVEAVIKQYNQADTSSYRDFFIAFKRIPRRLMYEFDKYLAQQKKNILQLNSPQVNSSQLNSPQLNSPQINRKTSKITDDFKVKEVKDIKSDKAEKEFNESVVVSVIGQYMSDVVKTKAGDKLEAVILKYFGLPEFNERFSNDEIVGKLVAPDTTVEDLLRKQPYWIYIIIAHLLCQRDNLSSDERGLFSDHFLEMDKNMAVATVTQGFENTFQILNLGDIFGLEEKEMTKLYKSIDSDDKLDDFSQILIDAGVTENQLSKLLEIVDQNYHLFTNDNFIQIMTYKPKVKKTVCEYLRELDDASTSYIDLAKMFDQVLKLLRRFKFKVNRNRLLSKLLGEIETEEEKTRDPNKEETLEDFLKRIGVDNVAAYKNCMSENVDLTSLYDLEETDLKELGFNIGQRSKIRRALCNSEQN